MPNNSLLTGPGTQKTPRLPQVGVSVHERKTMEHYCNLIDGEWRGEAFSQNISPSDTRDIVGNYAVATENDTKDAIAAAVQAFPSWSRSSPMQRHGILSAAAVEIGARREELGRLLAREEGKSLTEAIGEATRAAQIFDFFAGECLRQNGEIITSVRPGVGIEVTREPLGPVGLITPWNFPIAIPAWKLAPALAYGNTVVMKPADLVPGCAWELAAILERAGLPRGVFNLVMGPGSIVGQTMLDSPDLAALSFTGSTGVGARVAESSARLGRKFQLEMGGKNPLVVLDDAELDVAVECAVQGSFYSTGQRCTASSRLIVTKGIHDQFVERVQSRVAALKVGNALDPDTQIGPAVSQSQLQQDLEYVAIGTTEGANLLCGGTAIDAATPGYYIAPALFTGADNNMRIAREEIFGPVACAIEVDDYDEALALANDTEFGLSAGICTQSLRHAAHFRRNAQAGMVMVNLPTAGVDFHVPFGGSKASSVGSREQGRYAQEFFTMVKTAYTAAGEL